MNTRMKIGVFGPVGSGKSFLINEILGMQAVKEGVSVGPVTRELGYVEEAMEIDGNEEEVLVIDTPGLEGEGKTAKTIKKKLREKLESIDKAIIVIKNKRLEPTESADIKLVLEILNYRENPENFVFVINDGRNTLSEKQRDDNVADCLSILEISKYHILKINEQSNVQKTSKAIGLPCNKDQSFKNAIKTFKMNLNKGETSIDLGKEEEKQWNLSQITVALFAFASLSAACCSSPQVPGMLSSTGLLIKQAIGHTTCGEVGKIEQDNQGIDDSTLTTESIHPNKILEEESVNPKQSLELKNQDEGKTNNETLEEQNLIEKDRTVIEANQELIQGNESKDKETIKNNFHIDENDEAVEDKKYSAKEQLEDGDKVEDDNIGPIKSVSVQDMFESGEIDSLSHQIIKMSDLDEEFKETQKKERKSTDFKEDENMNQKKDENFNGGTDESIKTEEPLKQQSHTPDPKNEETQKNEQVETNELDISDNNEKELKNQKTLEKSNQNQDETWNEEDQTQNTKEDNQKKDYQRAGAVCDGRCTFLLKSKL